MRLEDVDVDCMEVHTVSELGISGGDGIQIVDDLARPCGRADCKQCAHEATCASAELNTEA